MENFNVFFMLLLSNTTEGCACIDFKMGIWDELEALEKKQKLS